MQGISAVVAAAGYGTLNGNKYCPKLLEKIAKRALISWSIQPLRDAHIGPILLVANPQCADALKHQLRQDEVHVTEIVLQPDRFGSADAVRRTISRLRHYSCRDVVVTYGDMPAWRGATVQRLIQEHRKTEADITMVVARLENGVPEVLKRYGRVIHDAEGRIRRIVEAKDANEAELASPFVNPSLWVWNLDWFEANVGELLPRSKGDGHAAEIHLPELVSIAYDGGGTVSKVELEDPHEALGVNTLEEMKALDELSRLGKVCRRVEYLE